MKVRKASFDDLEYIWEFEKNHRKLYKKQIGKKFESLGHYKSNKKDKKDYLDKIKKCLSNINTAIFILEDDDVPKGIVIGIIKDQGYITEIFIEKKSREKGNGIILMKNILRWFKEKKVKIISLQVAAKNKEAVSLYKKFGFEDFSYIMKKKL